MAENADEQNLGVILVWVHLSDHVVFVFIVWTSEGAISNCKYFSAAAFALFTSPWTFTDIYQHSPIFHRHSTLDWRWYEVREFGQWGFIILLMALTEFQIVLWLVLLHVTVILWRIRHFFSSWVSVLLNVEINISAFLWSQFGSESLYWCCPPTSFVRLIVRDF